MGNSSGIPKTPREDIEEDDFYDYESLPDDVRTFMDDITYKKKHMLVYDPTKEIRSLPNLNIEQLQNVRKLIVEKNKLSSFDGKLVVATMEEVSLQQNEITKVVGMRVFNQMKLFDVRNNRLPEVPDMSECSNLDEVFLDENAVTVLNEKSLPKELKTLSVSGNKISKGIKFNNMNHLRILHAKNIGIADFPKLTSCKSLEEVYLGGNKLTEIQGKLLPVKLQVLSVPDNQISNISDFEKLEEIKIFDVRNNHLKVIPPLRKHVFLKELYIDQNGIEIVDGELLPEWLELLSVSDNEIKEFIHTECMINLKALAMNTNRSSIVLPRLEVFSSLEKLMMSSNNISDTGKLHHGIKILDMSDNQLKDAGQIFSQLREATGINLSRNHIIDITSKDISRTITRLDLSHNQLIAMPDVSSMKQLKNLELQHNQIAVVPVAGNKSMLTLNLSYNNLEIFPDLHEWPKMTELDISHNFISAISSKRKTNGILPKISSKNGILPKRLRSLNASFNKINYINGALFTPQLQKINLENNNIICLSSLEKCNALVYLNINDNPNLQEIEQLPEKIQTISLKGITKPKEISLRRKCFPNEVIHNVLKDALQQYTDKIVSPPGPVFVGTFEEILKYFETIVEENSKEEEPIKVQVTEDGSSQVETTDSGGVFVVEEKHIYLSVPNEEPLESENHDESMEEENNITIQSNEIKEINHAVLKGESENSETVSEMVTMKPHGKSFKDHLMVKFPLSDTKNLEEYGLVYNITGDLQNPKWITIPKENPKYKHVDPFFWVIIDGFCCVFMTHFCDFALVKSPAYPEMASRWISFALCGKFNKTKKQLEVTILKGCYKCKKELISETEKYGVTLRQEDFLMIGETDKISFSLQLENWKTIVAPNIVHPLEMVQDCELKDIQSDRYILKPINKEVALDMEEDLVIRVEVSQVERITGKWLVSDVVTLNELAVKAKPPPDKKPVLRPSSTADEYDSEDEPDRLIPKSRPSSRGRPFLFHPRFKAEQKEFCDLLESNTEQYNKLLQMFEFNGGKNMVPVSFLQVLQTRVKEHNDHSYVWKPLLKALKDLKWPEAAKALEFLYEKDMIIKKMAVLKDNIRLDVIKDGLISKAIIFEKRDIDQFKHPMRLENDNLDFLFHHIILKESWRNGQKMLDFHKVLIKAGYKGIVDMITLKA